MTTNGIPPISDYAHWNEDAERMWYEENKYDMMHPEVFEEWDPYDDMDFHYDEPIPETECWERNRHCMNTSGCDYLFGPDAEIIADSNEVCSDCDKELVSTWIPNGYRVTYDTMIVYHQGFTSRGRRHYWSEEIRFPVFESIEQR